MELLKKNGKLINGDEIVKSIEENKTNEMPINKMGAEQDLK